MTLTWEISNTPIRYRLAALAAALFIVSGCESRSEEPSAAQRALTEMQAKYDELMKDKVDVPIDWAAEDLENIGDWEYRVVRLDYGSPEAFEAQLNEFGNERWQVIWLDNEPDGFLVVMKKPAISYLSRIPLTELGLRAIGGPAGSE